MKSSVLDSESLQSNGITFSRQVMQPKQLRKLLGHDAEVLARRLTNFRKFAPQKEAKSLLTSKYRYVADRVEDELGNGMQHDKLRRDWQKLEGRATEAHKRAKSIMAATEERWMELVKTKIVDEILERARNFEGAKALGVRDLMKYFRVEGDDIWSASRDVLLKTTPPEAPMLKRPKPDLYFSFPIIEQDRLLRGGFQREPGLRNLLRPNLERLEKERGVVSNPLKLLSRKGIKERHRVAKADANYCYYQAANSTANALALLHTLTDGISTRMVEGIRPVVAVTLVGHKTRLWIAGIKSRRKVIETTQPRLGRSGQRYTKVEYHMQCIWKGHLQLEEAIMQLLCIIQNLEQWIIDDFRPWVTRCISLHDSESDQESEGEAGDGITSDEDEWEPDGIEGSDVNDTDQSEDDMEEEERMWDEAYIPSGGEEEDPESSELDSDDEDCVEYELDKGRVDSLMQELMQGVSQLSVKDAPKSAVRVSNRFIKARNERGLQ
ncbi:hypothetical protein BDW74DRAFT_178039 [Aspergillus multicolor]|uniref:uncharacterized protein n=1 Tax=Aspergillus multicolor TaxID=41759 RepID=UPI003CCCCAD6